MPTISRRRFLGSAMGSALVAGSMTRNTVWGANERIRVCVVGFNGQGETHIRAFSDSRNARVVALCDVDERVLERGVRRLENRDGRKPMAFTDIRDALAREDIDVISIATPNHWHALAAIWACQAGKDVYVEKPLSHGIWEGRQVVAAAERYGRIVQHGTQNRSNADWMRDIQLMHAGFIGKIHMAKGFTYKTGRRGSIGFAEPEQAPRNLRWDLWQGPAEDARYHTNLVHYNWHWFWNYGNGETGNQGVHQMDVAMWGLNRGMPVRVHSTGGRYHWNDQGETPNTQISTYTYADGATLVFEVRNIGSYPEAGVLETGNTFWGENGYYVEDRGFFTLDHKPLPVPRGTDMPETSGPYENFLHAVRSRNPEDIHGTPLDGHRSSALCHMANISYRLGRSLDFDPDSERFDGDEEANAMLKRTYREGFEVPQLT